MTEEQRAKHFADKDLIEETYGRYWADYIESDGFGLYYVGYRNPEGDNVVLAVNPSCEGAFKDAANAIRQQRGEAPAVSPWQRLFAKHPNFKFKWVGLPRVTLPWELWSEYEGGERLTEGTTELDISDLEYALVDHHGFAVNPIDCGFLDQGPQSVTPPA